MESTIDAKQISDKYLASITHVEEQPATGRLRYVTRLEDDSLIHSDWISASDKGQAGLQWLEQARQTILQRKQEAASAARETLLKARAEAPAAPAVVLPPGVTPPPLVDFGPSCSWARTQLKDAQQQQQRAAKEVEYAKERVVHEEEELAEAMRVVESWKGVIAAMNGCSDAPTPPAA